jgi:MYXO-CTERM domain-containing protein
LIPETSMKTRLPLALLMAFLPVAASAWGTGAAQATTISFNDFSDTTGLHLLGSAATATTGGGKVLRLTPDIQSQAGAAYSTTPIQLGFSFTSTFQFRISHADTNNRADGMTFVMASTPNGLGLLGGGLGYEGIQHSVALEFDTFFNPTLADPNGNHIGFMTGGSNQTLSPVTPAFDLANGDIISVKVAYARNGAADVLSVFLNGASDAALSFTAKGGLDQLIGGSSVFLGFTGGTGGFTENNDVLNWQVVSDAPSAVPEPWTAGLAASGLLGLVATRRRKRGQT